jgi:hypothetical protein
VKHGYYGESAGQSVTVKKVGDGQLTIDGKTIPCELRQATIVGDGPKRISTIYYSDRVAPYHLRRETTIETADETQRVTTLVEAVALGLPERVLGELRTADYIKTTHKHPLGIRITLEVHCLDVPGGVVAHAATDSDASGKVNRRSSLELVAYEIGMEPENSVSPRRRLFHRPRPRRLEDR